MLLKLRPKGRKLSSTSLISSRPLEARYLLPSSSRSSTPLTGRHDSPRASSERLWSPRGCWCLVWKRLGTTQTGKPWLRIWSDRKLWRSKSKQATESSHSIPFSSLLWKAKAISFACMLYLQQERPGNWALSTWCLHLLAWRKRTSCLPHPTTHIPTRPVPKSKSEIRTQIACNQNQSE